MKKLLCVLLSAYLLLSFFGCAKDNEPTAAETVTYSLSDLYGTWEANNYYSEETAKTILTAMKFSDKEIAFADLKTLGAVKTVTLSEDGSYALGYDKEDTILLLTSYYTQYIEALYEHKNELTDVYGEEVKNCSGIDEFKSFFTFIFNASSFDKVVEMLVDGTVSDELFTNNVETGTYTVKNNSINMLKSGETQSESVAFYFKDGSLIIGYKDSVETYIKK